MNLLTVKQVAGMLQLSSSKVYQLVSQGKLPVYRIEGSVRVSEDDLQEYLRGCREVKQKAIRRKRVMLRYLSI